MRFKTQVFLVWLLMTMIAPWHVYASCSVTASTLYPTPYSNNQIDLTISNTGSSGISWIKVPVGFTSSLSNITADIQGAGWDKQEIYDKFIFANGTLNPGENVVINTTGNTGAQGEMIYWGLSTSLNIDGSDSEACNTLEFNITSTPPGPTPAPTPAPTATISDVSLTVGNSSATLTWNTNLTATGTVNYGTSDSYGSSVTTDSGTSHSRSVTGLAASTTYHYQIQVTSDGGTTSTTDATFTTSAASVTTTTTTTVTNTVTTTNTATVNKTVILADTVKPVVKIDTKLDKAVSVATIIEGKVIDGGAINIGIVKIQYSVDGGKSWLLVDEPSGASKVDFSFVPEVYEDGNYQILVRATDKSGNTGVSIPQTLIIDRLPPRIIHSLWRVGPIVLTAPYQLIPGVPVQVAVQGIGGIIEISLAIGEDKFELIKNPGTGLWENEIVLEEAGQWEIIVKAKDGGGNEIEQNIGNVDMRADNNPPLQDAITTIYRYDELIRRFKIWNGEVYGQDNPSKGKSSWYLPSGRYYIESKGKGYKTAQTEIFELDIPGVVGVEGAWEKWSWNNWWKRGELRIKQTNKLTGQQTNKLTGEQIIWLEKTEWRGKEINLTILPMWEPRMAEILAGLNEDSVVVIPGANKSSVDLLKSRGSYPMSMIADSDAEILSDLKGVSLPVSLKINRRGQVE